AFLEPPAAERFLHPPANGIPGGLVDPGGNAAIGDDLDAAIDQLHVNEDPAVALGVPYPKHGKDLERALTRGGAPQERQEVEPGLYRKSQFAIVRFFGFPYRFLDPVQSCARKRSPRNPVRGEQMLEDAPCLHLTNSPRPRRRRNSRPRR